MPLLLKDRNKKRLRLNNLSSWELQVPKYRVFYDVDPEKKHVVGTLKNRCFHQSGYSNPLIIQACC